MSTTRKLSPGRRQYLEFKRQYPDALLLFRMGDFYETFDEDAKTAARILDITLTQRDVGGGVKSPLAGIPYHALESYLGRLIRAGLKVAICEQVSDPSASKGIVDRAVVRVVTPGTVLEPGLLDEGRNNYLAAMVVTNDRAGLAYVDVTTGEFKSGEIDPESASDELSRIAPAEVLVDEGGREVVESGRNAGEWTIRDLPPARLDHDSARDLIKRHFGATTLEPYGLERLPLATMASAAILDFLSENHLGQLPQVTSLSTFRPEEYLIVDRRALRDLEVFESAGGMGSGTLFAVLDRTKTSMGRRLLRMWLYRPLRDLEVLAIRQDAVGALVTQSNIRRTAQEKLAAVPDLERLVNRIRLGSASPRDLVSLGNGLRKLPELQQVLEGSEGALAELACRLKPCPEVVSLIDAALEDDPSTVIGEGRAIRAGFDGDLDEVRDLATNARGRLAAIEEEARSSTGVRSLKVGYNKIFGYYIEVSKPNLDRIPPEFERRQTLVNAERFVTPGLKELESQILNARDRISELERSIFQRLCKEISAHAERILASARAYAELDVLSSFAESSAEFDYVRPEVGEYDEIDIKGGRHPMVEQALGAGRFVPNDTRLSGREAQLAIVTGPNMAGKSTYIRQVALILLMAHVGCFVPAEKARIALTDRIFTRCNLSDDISQGRSTFLVEMEETATILHQATRKSLVVLDEIGRGTSTYDGLAIARAVAEYIHSSPRLGCKTLFATHYHEMTALADALPRAVNYQVAVSEDNGEVVFLHRIMPGGADRSYGVHVGRLAGLPSPVVTRAWELLDELEGNDGRGKSSRRANRRTSSTQQLSLLNDGAKLRHELLQLDISSMTPLQAITKLFELQEQARDQSDGFEVKG